MSLTEQDRRNHELYESFPGNVRKIVDDAYTAAREVLVDCGLPVDNCDAAEALVAAIARYVDDSARLAVSDAYRKQLEAERKAREERVAKAAPALLAALEDWERFARDNYSEDPDSPNYASFLPKTIAALAAARGESK